jgi:hypothetical protein
MRHRLPWIALATLLVAAPAPAAVEIEGVEFPERVRVSDTELRLNGVGLLRWRTLFRGYVAGLYLGPDVTPEAVLDDVPRRLEIEYFWSIDAADFAVATVEGIRRNVPADELPSLRGAIEQMNALYADVDPGDRYALTYVPGVGTELSLNGEPRGVVEGAGFARAVFSIWLGDAPLDTSLKRKLLEEK